jgi:hypothetical protein
MKSMERDSRSASREPLAVGGLEDYRAGAKMPNFKTPKHLPLQDIKFDGTRDASCKN